MSKPTATTPLASATVIQPKKQMVIAPFISKSSRKPFGASTAAKKVSAPPVAPVKRLFNLLDEEEDTVILPPKRALIKLLDDERDDTEAYKRISIDETKSSKEGEEEPDPLDAFMTDMATAPIPTISYKGTRNDIDNDDDLDTFLQQRERDSQSKEETSFLDDYDSGAEDYLSNARSENIKQKKFIEPLPMVYHSEIEYEPFRKDFYHESVSISNLSEASIAEFRKKHHIRVSGEACPSPVQTFEQLGLGERIMKAIEKQQFATPTPIQCQSIPAALSGRDIIGIAKTGSGKTAAFVWPMLMHIKAQPPLRKGDGPIGLIIAPTRELAQQIYLETKRYAKYLKLRVCPIYGGVPKAEQVKELKRGVEILVCTPGRLIDVVKMKKITNMRRVTFMVFDEADKMFNMGFEIQVRSIANQVRPDRQTLLFSATFKKSVENVAQDILTNPVRISVGIVGEEKANADVKQFVHVVSEDVEKWDWIIPRLPGFQKHGSVLIFVGTKHSSEVLSDNLNQSGFSTLALHGDKTQQERDEIMKQYKTQKIPILVATDVVARGLDIKSIKTVINFDVAKDIDSHIHRIGRTGRAGASDGVAYTLVGPKNKIFAGHLADSLKLVKQIVPPKLVALAMTDPRYAQRHGASGSRGGRGGRGRGSQPFRGGRGGRGSRGGRGARRGLGFSSPSTGGAIQFQRSSE